MLGSGPPHALVGGMTMLSLVTGETSEIEFLPLEEETTDRLTAEEIDAYLEQLRAETEVA